MNVLLESCNLVIGVRATGSLLKRGHLQLLLIIAQFEWLEFEMLLTYLLYESVDNLSKSVSIAWMSYGGLRK